VQLRDKVPVRLLPAHALLPQVDISETQVARDNALIAGEVDLAMGGTAPSQHVPKAQYLNDQG